MSRSAASSAPKSASALQLAARCGVCSRGRSAAVVSGSRYTCAPVCTPSSVRPRWSSRSRAHVHARPAQPSTTVPRSSTGAPPATASSMNGRSRSHASAWSGDTRPSAASSPTPARRVIIGTSSAAQRLVRAAAAAEHIGEAVAARFHTSLSQSCKRGS